LQKLMSLRLLLVLGTTTDQANISESCLESLKKLVSELDGGFCFIEAPQLGLAIIESLI